MSEPAATAGKTAVEVGQVFAQGHTDGLTLYALILGTFLMFLIALIAVTMLTRALSKKDDTNAKQTADFIACVDRTSVAMNALAQNISTGSAVQQNQVMTMARLEALLGRLDHEK